MALDPKAKEKWQEIQKKFNVPVSAIGVPIKESESIMLKIWKDEGIDQCMKK